jgi:hypothetical protein
MLKVKDTFVTPFGINNQTLSNEQQELWHWWIMRWKKPGLFFSRLERIRQCTQKR